MSGISARSARSTLGSSTRHPRRPHRSRLAASGISGCSAWRLRRPPMAIWSLMVKSDDAGWWKANFYAVKSTLDLYNNFTWSLSGPVKGDQFHQHDGRTMVGGNASRTFQGTLGGVRTETMLGVQTRYDDIDLGLTNTFQRTFLSDIRSDRVAESSIGIYAENTLYWTDWLRTTLGWRGDYYDGEGQFDLRC